MTGKAKPIKTPKRDSLNYGLAALAIEIDAVRALEYEMLHELGRRFEQAIERILKTKGRVIVSGMGKSGHVAGKIASTLASTGTPAFFVHPGEASHGDLGMITKNDLIIALSWSGETVELRNVVGYAKRLSVPLIAITANADSALARAANLVLLLPDVKEACPHGLAPTSSALLQMAIGDLLAVSLLKLRGFSLSNFKNFHPGGRLGAYLTNVGEIMHTGTSLPLVKSDMAMKQAIVVMSRKGFGCLVIADDQLRLRGIITDGDLRRHLEHDLRLLTVGEVMTKTPRLMVSPDTLLVDAMNQMNKLEVTVLLVVEHQKLLGLVHIHDILRVGVK